MRISLAAGNAPFYAAVNTLHAPETKSVTRDGYVDVLPCALRLGGKRLGEKLEIDSKARPVVALRTPLEHRKRDHGYEPSANPRINDRLMRPHGSRG